MWTSTTSVLETFAFGSDPPWHGSGGSEAESTATSPTITSPNSNAPYASVEAKTPTATQISIGGWTLPLRRQQNVWNPSVLQVRPLVGLLALCVTSSCVFASFAVLLVSDGQPVSDWPLSPAVSLAIITAAANSALALAYMEAVPISWWYSTTRGRSIRALERQWRVTRSIVSAVAYLRHLSVLNIACILVAIVVIDGPLLQKASTVVSGTTTSDVTLYMHLLPELPSNFSGTVWNHRITASLASQLPFQDLAAQRSMKFEVPQCSGSEEKCTAKIQGPGVMKTDCTSRTWPITKEMIFSINATWGTWKQYDPSSYIGPAMILPAFQVSIEPIYDTISGGARTTVGLAGWRDFEGQYVETSCTLLPAIVEYNVLLQSGNVQLLEDLEQGKVVAKANNTRAINTTEEMAHVIQPNAFDPVTVGAGYLVSANATVMISTARGSKGFAPTWAFNVPSFNIEAAKHVVNFPGQAAGTGMLFSDPTPDIIRTMNELMLRGAIYASKWRNQAPFIDSGVEINQIVPAVKETRENLYKSDLRWFAGAAIFELLTALAVLPMFWGWWKIGQDLTLSPFQIALAFDAPLLRDVNSASGVWEIVQQLGRLKLKYGVDTNLRYAAHGEDVAYAPGRLGLACEQVVAPPRKGWAFRE
ncbi:uncharacterized protein LTR77_003173 [Saxophila tyrrhenica]|uniref:Uncharacterized protein n=1 Tax=Saxophila tyrrhenica TaxID=1690608 RepID=A0AAV9PH66_9PEZI|nr:hypothetical protein LTR77_003173 [Saxophila tyrrhenica]